MTTAPPRTRRSHTKSRGGCAECKRRKKKCNEERPICAGCRKRRTLCDYSISESSYPVNLRSYSLYVSSSEAFTSRHRDRDASPEGPCSSTNARTLGAFDADDMALWHHFITDTAATLAGPWDPRLAGSCDYLMHGTLSTAALHLAYLNPSQRDKYEEVSSQHRNLALGPFRLALSHITPENCHNVFSFSVLLIIAQFAPSDSPRALGLPGTALYKGPANWIVCLRACDSILSQATVHMVDGPFGTLLADAMGAMDLTEKVELRKTEDDESLERLSRRILAVQAGGEDQTKTTTLDEMEAYAESISLLRKMLTASSSTSDPLSARIFSSLWATQASEMFILMLHEERPAALCILAHYCLLLNRCHSCWYTEHRAYDLLMAITQGLPEEWMSSVEYPLRVIQRPGGRKGYEV